MEGNLGDNNIHSWEDLRKGNWPMLNFINVEVNRAPEMRWLSELDTCSKMEMLCINSVRKNKTLHDSIFCAKLKVRELIVCCKALAI